MSDAHNQDTGRFDADEADRIAQQIESGEVDRMAQEGQRLRSVITTRDFLPGRDKAVAIRFGANAAPGTYQPLGFVAGQINAFERKTNTWEGKELASVWLQGEFEATIGATGEIINAPFLIFPRSYGELIASAFASVPADAQQRPVIAVDVEIGIEATGKSITYEWVVRNYSRTTQRAVIQNIRRRQLDRMGTKSMNLLAASAPKTIDGTTNKPA